MPYFIAAGLTVLVLLVGNIPSLTGRVAPQWDAVDFFGPSFSLVADYIKHGQLVLWNPWVDAGSPDYVEPELGTTSPILLAAAFLAPNSQSGFVAYWLLMWIWGALGMFVLSTYLKAPPWGSLVVALGFAASGFFTGHAEHTSSLYSVSFLPWIMWRFDAALVSRRILFALQAGALYGLSGLGGYPAFTISTAGFLLLWALGSLLTREAGFRLRTDARKNATYIVVTLAAVAVVGLAIWSPPHAGMFLTTKGYTDYLGPRPRIDSLTSGTFPPEAFSTFASPFLGPANTWPVRLWPTDVSMSSIYVGPVLLALALFSLQAKSARRWGLLLTVVFFAAASVGGRLPVRGWLYDFVAPTQYFRNAALFRGYVIFGLAVLAALGVRDVVASWMDRGRRKVLFGISALLACTALLVFFYVVHRTPNTFPSRAVAIVHAVTVWTGFGVVVLCALARNVQLRTLSFAIAALAVFDVLGNLYISQPVIGSAGTTAWWQEMNSGKKSLDVDVARVLDAPGIPTYRQNRNIATRIPVLRSRVVLKNHFNETFVNDPLLSRIATGRNRIWFCPNPGWSAPDDPSFQAFAADVHASGRIPLLVHTPEQMRLISSNWLSAGSHPPPPSAAGNTCAPIPVNEVAYTQTRLAFRVSTASAGWLLVTDRWASGWSVTLNGRSSPVYGGDFLYRAVPLGTGTTAVDFQYKPAGFIPTVMLSWGTLLVIVGCTVYDARQRRTPCYHGAK